MANQQRISCFSFPSSCLGTHNFGPSCAWAPYKLVKKIFVNPFRPLLKPGAQPARIAGEFGVAEAFNRSAFFDPINLNLAFPIGDLRGGLGPDLLVRRRRGG